MSAKCHKRTYEPTPSSQMASLRVADEINADSGARCVLDRLIAAELYRFRYKGSDPTAYVGVMAQEVQKIEPSAVWRDRSGYLVVNYDRIGLKFMTWKEWLTLSRSN